MQARSDGSAVSGGIDAGVVRRVARCVGAGLRAAPTSSELLDGVDAIFRACGFSSYRRGG